ncbi:MAG: CocE/NonD family hydrolase [Planctomycetales bacterium]|nr:CocE/NonD family hydrolase [Planctomycetales bacterium]
MTSSPGSECGLKLWHDLGVPMRDGVRLSADVFLPDRDGPFPTIVTRTPYESGRDVFLDVAAYWARRGFAFVAQDCRGRFESEGTFRAYADDPTDGYDTIEWVGGQGWCNGKIGTWGRSYGGLTQWLSAPLAHPQLTCMAPHVICDDFYSDCHYIGGAFQLMLSLGAAVIWQTNLATVVGPQSRHVFQNRRFWSHLPLIEMDELAIGRRVEYWREWLAHPTYGDYWKPFDIRGRHAEITVPAFQQCGWFDPYTGSGFRNLNGMQQHGPNSRAREQQRILVGPWSHEEPTATSMGGRDFGPGSLLDIRAEEHRWFDWQLKGIDDGIASEPPIRIFTMGANSWRSEAEWPLERSVVTPLFLHSTGRAGSSPDDGRLTLDPPGDEPVDRFHYDPAEPVPTLGGVLSVHMMTAHAEEPLEAGAVDQRLLEKRDDVLVYTTPVLAEPVEVTGPVSVVLYAESNARDTDFTARLVDVAPDGTAFLVTEGILRARYRNGLKQTELLAPGVAEQMEIVLYPTSIVFAAGHRIRLDISSSNFPRFSRNLNTGEDVGTGTRMLVAANSVLHSQVAPSQLVLPVVDSTLRFC